MTSTGKDRRESREEAYATNLTSHPTFPFFSSGSFMCFAENHEKQIAQVSMQCTFSSQFLIRVLHGDVLSIFLSSK